MTDTPFMFPAYCFRFRRTKHSVLRGIAIGCVATVVGCTSAVAALSEHPPVAGAAGACSVGDSGTTINRAGIVGHFSGLRPMRGMNCPSAQYVLNRWLRPSFGNSYSRRLPTNFYDGYVTWHCGKLSRLRWQCDEYDSGTVFQFTGSVTY